MNTVFESILNNIGQLLVVITALLVAAGGIYKSFSNYRLKSEDSMATNYQKIFDRQDKDYAELSSRMARLEEAQRAERQQWNVDRVSLEERINTLTAQNSDKDRLIYELQGEIHRLKAAVSETNAVVAEDMRTRE